MEIKNIPRRKFLSMEKTSIVWSGSAHPLAGILLFIGNYLENYTVTAIVAPLSASGNICLVFFFFRWFSNVINFFIFINSSHKFLVQLRDTFVTPTHFLISYPYYISFQKFSSVCTGNLSKNSTRGHPNAVI